LAHCPSSCCNYFQDECLWHSFSSHLPCDRRSAGLYPPFRNSTVSITHAHRTSHPKLRHHRQLDLRFGPGLIILTGETGAGKSIILDAVVMLIGGKADTTFVRTDSDAAFVEGVFQLKGPEKEAVHEILKREELMDDPDYVTLMREVRKEGRSVARVNGRTVNVGLLKELGALLVDIHGQAEHLSLLDPRAHLGLLDRYAEVAKPLTSTARPITPC
jgi:DNA repair protein RecN (Recombination protein N)